MQTTYERKLAKRNVKQSISKTELVWSFTSLSALLIGPTGEIPGAVGLAVQSGVVATYFGLLLYATRKRRKALVQAIEDLEMLAEVEGYLHNPSRGQKSVGGDSL